MDFNGKRVLVVDDNSLNLIAAERLISSFGLQVSTASSGQECEAKLTSGETYDLIFMDDMMPGMSGTDTLHVIKNLPKFNTRVIALTANVVEGVDSKYKSLGFSDYLAKPIKKDELEKVLINNLNAHDEFENVPKDWLNISDDVVSNVGQQSTQPEAPQTFAAPLGAIQPVGAVQENSQVQQ